MSRRNVSILTIAVSSFIVLTQFQNCAPAGSSTSSASTDASGQIRTIEDFNKTELQFFAPEIQVHDEAAITDVGGFCNRSHNGASLRWSMWAGAKNGTPILSGDSVCARGEFKLTLEELPNMVCGVSHLVVVEGDWGGSTFAHVVRRCQPLGAEELLIPTTSPAGTSCSLEYMPAGEGASPCSQVCYRDDKVVSARPVDAAQCSGIAAKLAGP